MMIFYLRFFKGFILNIIFSCGIYIISKNKINDEIIVIKRYMFLNNIENIFFLFVEYLKVKMS